MTSTELKHHARLKEWALAIQECRSSELSVKQWCTALLIAFRTVRNMDSLGKGNGSTSQQEDYVQQAQDTVNVINQAQQQTVQKP